VAKKPVSNAQSDQQSRQIQSENPDALSFIKGRYPEASNFQEIKVRAFLGGHIHYINYDDEDGDIVTEVVYREGNKLEYLEYPEDVVEKVQERFRYSMVERMGNAILSTGGITGFLALIMTIAVIYMSIFGVAIPNILEQALLLAFGFYFGKVKTA